MGYPAVCSVCGRNCSLPFKPIHGRPVYCNKCFAAHSPKRSKQLGFRREAKRLKRENSGLWRRYRRGGS